MAANVVAFSVQTGSGGYPIARQVAERLGYKYYDWEITQEAARLAGVPPTDVVAAERVPGFLERMMRRLGAISAMTIEGTPGFSDPSPAVWNTALQSLTSEDYRQFIERVVEGLAQSGQAVIVGHAGQHILRSTPGVLKVFIHGSPEHRINRYTIEQGVPRTEAEAAIKQSDKDRHNLLRTVYHFDWTDASIYDITINTDHLTDEWAVDTITTATQSLP